jgi:hypothetical protein
LDPFKDSLGILCALARNLVILHATPAHRKAARIRTDAAGAGRALKSARDTALSRRGRARSYHFDDAEPVHIVPPRSRS